MHTEPRDKPKWKPEPLPRPGIAKPVEKPEMTDEQRAFLAQHLARTQGAQYN